MLNVIMLSVVVLNFIMLIAVILNVAHKPFMPSVIILRVVMPSVMAPRMLDYFQMGQTPCFTSCADGPQ
jgi:hypothetical protein